MKLPPTLAEAAKLCAKWSHLEAGVRVPCRSKAIGRELTMKPRGTPERAAYKVEACVVPHYDVKHPCRPSFLVRPVGGGAALVVPNGKVKNAQRTPRPMHRGMDVEWVAGQIVDGPRERIRDNEAQGLHTLTGIDLPFPHRVGSSVCCPESSRSAAKLADLVRDRYEVDGLISRPLARQLEALAAHLRTRHRVAGLARDVGPEDFDAAFRIVEAGTAYCRAYLFEWEERAEHDAAERRVTQKKKRAAKKSRARRAAKKHHGAKLAAPSLAKTLRGMK